MREMRRDMHRGWWNVCMPRAYHWASATAICSFRIRFHRMFADILLFELCCRNCVEVTRYNAGPRAPGSILNIDRSVFSEGFSAFQGFCAKSRDFCETRIASAKQDRFIRAVSHLDSRSSFIEMRILFASQLPFGERIAFMEVMFLQLIIRSHRGEMSYPLQHGQLAEIAFRNAPCSCCARGNA